ncbi:septation protein SepH [Ornithinimicrobium sp. LYQ121]|uniref:septation protein SepH n=1 Tax=Ornithinimicrobium sp. LYQ121 TaxID=3378801 RepID=UPI0038541374
MQQLHFDELDEGGRLVVVADDGTRYVVAVDDRLRAALRARPHAPRPDRDGGASATPREVQAMIRAGQTAEEVAEGTGWELARVRRFEGPVLAEREHVVGLARAAHVRANGRTDGSHTLERRVRERLQKRGVTPAEVSWDAARTEHQGPWTVLVIFSAGGKERRAAWHYDVADRSIDALDDEARWLSEDEQALPGGLAGHPLLGASHAEDETADLMAAMRERRQRRGRRPRKEPAGSGGGVATGPLGEDDLAAGQGAAAPHVPGQEPFPEEHLPFEELGEPPAAHPRGSAAESPSPVHPVEVGTLREDVGSHEDPSSPGSSEPSDRGPSARESERRRERRRLRLPKLPAPVDAPVEEKDDEVIYARTADPSEVSFEEFFGTDGELFEDEVDDLDLEVDDPESQDREEPEQLDGSEGVDQLQDVEDDDAPVPSSPQTSAQARATPVEGADAADPAASDETPRRKGRTSVPSWDDIMFGSGDRRRG